MSEKAAVDKRLPLSKSAEALVKAYVQKRMNSILEIAEIRANLVHQGKGKVPTEISGDDVTKAIIAFEVLEKQ